RVAGDGHRRIDHDANSRAVHRANRRGDVAAPAGAGLAKAVSDVALSRAESGGSAGMDLHLRDDACRRGRVWIGRAAAWCAVFRSVVVEGTNVAVRGRARRGLTEEPA